MAQRFAAAADPAQALKVALDYAREQASSGRTAPHVEAGMAERLRQMAQARGAEALAAASVWDRLCEVSGDAAGRAEIDAAVSAMGGLAQRLAQIEDDSIARRAAALVRRVLPDGWGAVFEQAMLMAPLKRCESLGRELADAGPEALNRVAATVLADRDRCPEAFAWLWRIVAEGRPDAPAGLDPTDLTLAFLILAARLLRAGSGLSDDQARSVRGAVKTVLSGNDYAAVRRVIEGCSPDAARRLRMAVLNNRGLTDDGREVLDNALLSAHPDVFVEVKQPWEDEAVIWTTQEGMAKRRAALERLMDVEMPANARAVGEAAAKGDLSENAEWTAAIEERNLLAKRAETIQEELRRARVIPHDMANQETVTVGSRVRVRNLSAGREDNFVFLGPWDVDVEHGVYDYRAPLSRAFMGKRSGDRVAAGEGDQRREFEVLAVESAV
jgi:transcription elongation factor GreA